MNQAGPPAATRCGFVALIGAPNVGKSTLVNALVGSKVTIVSRKVQTTRALIRGIVIEDHAQIILVDTPGIFCRSAGSTAPWSRPPGAAPMTPIWSACCSTPRPGLDEEAEAILSKARGASSIRKILVLNKIDLVPREKLLALAQAANERLTFVETFMVSALSGDGVDDSAQALAEMVPAGPFHYPEDQMSDAPMRHLAAEITREKIYRSCTRNCPINRPSRPTAGPSARTIRSASSRRSLSSATASARSCSARPAPPSNRSGRTPARRSPRSSATRASVSVRQGARELGRRSRSLPPNGTRVPQGIMRIIKIGTSVS